MARETTYYIILYELPPVIYLINLKTENLLKYKVFPKGLKNSAVKPSLPGVL